MSNLVNDLAAAWGPYFLLTVVQNSAFLALVFLGLRIFRQAPAHVRALIATLGVIKLAIPPFLPVGWIGPPAAEQVVSPVSTFLFPFAELGPTGTGSASGFPGGLSALALLMLVWAVMAFTRLGHGLLQTVRLALALRDAQAIPAQDLPAELTRQGVSVWCSRRIALPLTLGLRPRRIYVPASWDQWPAINRQAVLRHELAHIRRHDGLIQALEIIAQALFFFLPPVGWLVRRLHTYREMACDDASVVADPHARLAYSTFLCSLAESTLDMTQASASASTLARYQGELLERVAYQVKEGVVKKVSAKQLILVLTILACAAVPLSLVYGDNPKTKPAPPPPPAAPEAPAKDVPGEVLVPADAPPAEDVPPPPPPTLKIAIRAGRELEISGEPVPPQAFKKTVKAAVAVKGGQAVVSIDSDGDVTMAQLHGIQKDLKDLGLRKVIYTGELGEAVPMVLPPDEARKKLKVMPPEKISHVHVDAQGVVLIDGQETPGARISDRIRKILTLDKYKIVVLHTDPDTKYGAFVQVLNDLKQGGAAKIALTDPGD